MMGVTIDGPTLVFCNNKSVITSNFVTQWTLGKKHLIIFYHAVRETFTELIHRIAHIDGNFNHSDILKNLDSGN